MFRSFAWGGFEGASQLRPGRRRIDSVAGSGHERWAPLDHAILRGMGAQVARESFRWHLIERGRGRYDWSSAERQIQAAQAAGVEVVWGLCHWGIPGGMDVMAADWPRRLAEFSDAAARMLVREGADVAGFVPVNEMAFWSWAGAEVGRFHPFLRGRGDALKRQLVRGHLAAVAALRDAGAVAPIIVCEPLIWVTPDAPGPAAAARARAYVDASLEAVDRILDADPAAIDVVGLNHYDHNQWQYDRSPVHRGEPGHRALRDLLGDVARRYAKPLVLAETGAEEPLGDEWLAHVTGEARAARAAGVPLEGVCVYPIVDYPGWEDGRHCPCGPIGTTPDGRRFVRPGQSEALRRLGAVGTEPIGAVAYAAGGAAG